MRLSFILSLLFYTASIPLQAQIGVEVDVGDDDDEDEQVIWIGPGWYYGVWFDNEVDYDGWYRDHGHDYHHGHHRGGYHSEGPHGGGHQHK